jgi:hypothetical protein
MYAVHVMCQAGVTAAKTCSAAPLRAVESFPRTISTGSEEGAALYCIIRLRIAALYTHGLST